MSAINSEELKAHNQGKDRYVAPDLYAIDDLLTEEHKLIRSSVREWVKRELSPIIEEYAQRGEFPHHILKGLGEIGAFGPQLPAEYGCGGMDYITYGIIMQ
ncbi:MAG: acyl-CoA dehydrogenase family protein, partial [Bacteroidia bacterium]|nr:acyl-CoA dehydrogenase family protein [Bacteroidia bacterium]